MSDDPAISDDPTRKRHVGDESPTEAVVNAVAAARDCEPTDLPPLNDTIDPDALDGLFADTITGPAREGGRIVFEYGGCTVTLLGTGDVRVDVND
ncbi:HalOD1 output domain-containing protein [Halorussus salinisoli]|uniref:HalOD1 output domain-containing protein n=1 Tax=Halorussus salinisoli TaxID=2558242 RepID=UPI00148582C1|nr:HalOD1 output domain-containing protein [Halorussus salinisoli]